MEFLDALASLAQQHPSTPMLIEIEHVDADPADVHWEAAIFLTISDDETACVAAGEGQTAQASLEDLLARLNAAPIR